MRKLFGNILLGNGITHLHTPNSLLGNGYHTPVTPLEPIIYAAISLATGTGNGYTHRLATPIASVSHSLLDNGITHLLHQLSPPSMLALTSPQRSETVTHTDWQADGGWQKNRGQKDRQTLSDPGPSSCPHFSVKRNKLGRAAMSPGVASFSQHPLRQQAHTPVTPIEPIIYVALASPLDVRNGNTHRLAGGHLCCH